MFIFFHFQWAYCEDPPEECLRQPHHDGVGLHCRGLCPPLHGSPHWRWFSLLSGRGWTGYWSLPHSGQRQESRHQDGDVNGVWISDWTWHGTPSADGHRNEPRHRANCFPGDLHGVRLLHWYGQSYEIIDLTCFSPGASLMAPDGKYLYLAGTLSSGLSTLIWLGFINIFFRSQLLFQVGTR